MVITRTPFRVSLFGGGTDYPGWYRNFGGSTLVTTIDKYAYISCRKLPPFFEHRYRVVYSKVETTSQKSEIQHPAVRAVLEFMRISDGLEIHYDGDLPARSGLGSSSSFTVGLIRAISEYCGKSISRFELAKTAIEIEQNLMKEAVGSQDQVAASYGGFNRIDFSTDDSIGVAPLAMPEARKQEFESHLMLFFTGIQRNSTDIAAKQIANQKFRQNELSLLQKMVDEACAVLSSKTESLDEIGHLLDVSWRIKRKLAPGVTNQKIDEIYEAGISAGALGGKLLGAGAGGFILFYAKPEHQAAIRERLRTLIHVPFKFEEQGCTTLFTSEPRSSRTVDGIAEIQPGFSSFATLQ